MSFLVKTKDCRRISMAYSKTAYNESQLHQFGKMCFEDAEGKTITLPKSASPMFVSPMTFSVSRVEFEKAVPFAGFTGRQPDLLLTDENGRKLIIEITYSNSKSENYIHDMGAVGMSLALELDVGKWKKNPAIMPDFSQGTPLQKVIDQTKWLSCGLPREMEWRPYAFVLYECGNDYSCKFCQMIRGGVRVGSRGLTTRLFYYSPHDKLSDIAKQAGLELVEAREKVYGGLSSYSIDCKDVSVMHTTPDGKWIDSIEDRLPDRTHRELGWVLLRDGIELPKYRVRRMSGGFQAVVYKHGFEIGQPDRDQINDFQNMISSNSFRVRKTWKEAVKDLFQHLAPLATPLHSLRNDEWLPANAPIS